MSWAWAMRLGRFSIVMRNRLLFWAGRKELGGSRFAFFFVLGRWAEHSG